MDRRITASMKALPKRKGNDATTIANIGHI